MTKAPLLLLCVSISARQHRVKYHKIRQKQGQRRWWKKLRMHCAYAAWTARIRKNSAARKASQAKEGPKAIWPSERWPTHWPIYDTPKHGICVMLSRVEKVVCSAQEEIYEHKRNINCIHKYNLMGGPKKEWKLNTNITILYFRTFDNKHKSQVYVFFVKICVILWRVDIYIYYIIIPS